MPAPCLRPSRPHAIVLTLGLLLLLPGGVAQASLGRPQSPFTAMDGVERPLAEQDLASRPLVLVLPLAARSGSEPGWFTAGAARFLEEALSLGGYQVVDEAERRALLHRSGLAAQPRLSLASACHLARDAGARYVLIGTWRDRRGEILVSLRAVDVSTMSLLAEVTERGQASDPGTLLGRVSAGVMFDGRVDGGLKELAERPSAALMAWLQAAAEPELAEQHLRAAVDLAPGFVPARLALCEVLLDSGRLDEAGRIVDGTRVDGVHRLTSLLLKGRLHLAQDEARPAVLLFQEAVHEHPSVAALSWLAEAQLATGDREGAAATARRVLGSSADEAGALALLRRTQEGR